MTTDLLSKTRRLLSRSACPRELCDFAEWLSSEGYTPAPIHIPLSTSAKRFRACVGLMIPVRALLATSTGLSSPEADHRLGGSFSRVRAARTPVFCARVIASSNHDLKTDSRSFAVSTSSTSSSCAGCRPRHGRIT